MRRAALALSTLSACAPSTEGHFIEPDGARSLVVVQSTEGGVEAFALDLEGDSDRVWFPAAAGDVDVVRYRCGLATLGLPAGALMSAPDGRSLPRSTLGAVPSFRLAAPLPACRPLTVRRLDLPAEIRWLSSDGRAALVGHRDAVSWVGADGELTTHAVPASVYALGVGGRTTLFLEEGLTQAFTRAGPTGPPSQPQAGLWDRWMVGSASSDAAWLLTDRGAVVELREDGAEAQASLSAEGLEPTALVATDGNRAWAGGPSIEQLVRLDRPDTRLPALDGRTSALTVAQSTLVVATERGAVSAWKDSAWAPVVDLEAPIVALAPVGSGLIALSEEGRAYAIDVDAGHVCAVTELDEPVGPPYVAVGEALYARPRGQPSLSRIAFVDGRACPGPLSP